MIHLQSGRDLPRRPGLAQPGVHRRQQRRVGLHRRSFTRNRSRSATRCAATARYTPRPPRRLISRFTTVSFRPNRVAISRPESPAWIPREMSSRSTNVNSTPGTKLTPPIKIILPGVRHPPIYVALDLQPAHDTVAAPPGSYCQRMGYMPQVQVIMSLRRKHIAGRSPRNDDLTFHSLLTIAPIRRDRDPVGKTRTAVEPTRRRCGSCRTWLIRGAGAPRTRNFPRCSHQPRPPMSSWNVPVGPSGPMVASRATICALSSAGRPGWLPGSPPPSAVAVMPGSTALILIPG